MALKVRELTWDRIVAQPGKQFTRSCIWFYFGATVKRNIEAMPIFVHYSNRKSQKKNHVEKYIRAIALTGQEKPHKVFSLKQTRKLHQLNRHKQDSSFKEIQSLQKKNNR